MKIKQMLLLVLLLFYACKTGRSQAYTLHTLESGKPIKILQMGQCSLSFPETEETGLALTYQTALAIGNESELDQEMTEISEWLKVEAERAGMRLISINAVETIRASEPSPKGNSILFREEMDGQWHSIKLVAANRLLRGAN